jgi:hypothetical protein
MLYRSLGRSPLSVAKEPAIARGVGRPCLIQVLFNTLQRSNGFSKKRYVPPIWLKRQAAFPGLHESSEGPCTTRKGGFRPGYSVSRAFWPTVRPKFSPQRRTCKVLVLFSGHCSQDQRNRHGNTPESTDSEYRFRVPVQSTDLPLPTGGFPPSALSRLKNWGADS